MAQAETREISKRMKRPMRTPKLKVVLSSELLSVDMGVGVGETGAEELMKRAVFITVSRCSNWYSRARVRSFLGSMFPGESSGAASILADVGAPPRSLECWYTASTLTDVVGTSRRTDAAQGVTCSQGRGTVLQ